MNKNILLINFSSDINFISNLDKKNYYHIIISNIDEYNTIKEIIKYLSDSWFDVTIHFDYDILLKLKNEIDFLNTTQCKICIDNFELLLDKNIDKYDWICNLDKLIVNYNIDNIDIKKIFNN